MKNILNIIKDVNYSFSLFSQSLIDKLEQKITVKDGNNRSKLDKNSHLIIDHDLHNHGGELPSGVAEKFIEWAKSEHLSFWK